MGKVMTKSNQTLIRIGEEREKALRSMRLFYGDESVY